MIFIPIFREITSCFRHLEKPIKTKEHKIKHLFLYVLLVFNCFFRRRKQIYSNAKPQRHRGFSFYEHEMRERNEGLRLFCIFRVQIKSLRLCV